MSSAPVLTVLTFKSADHIVADGGTQSWVLSRKRVLACEYVVCARHRQGPWKPEGPEAHKHAFLVGKISDVVPSSETPGRWRVEFSEFAIVDGPKLPLDSASPTQYFPSLESLGIDKTALEWQATAVEAAGEGALMSDAPPRGGGISSILLQAKTLVANGLNVPIEAVEITIRA